MLSSFSMYLGVKFHWIPENIITMSSVQSDMAANFWRAWWAWLICVTVTIAVSSFTKKKPKEELTGLVRGLTKETIEQNIPLTKRPEFYAVIALIVFIILNIIFW